jgi:gluconate kinase
MPPAMLTSQFDALEIPGHAIVIDIADSPEKIVATVISRLKL